MHCLITAGGVAPPADPIYVLTQGKPKALLAMNGRTMLERVVDALQGAHSIQEIVVVGLGSDMGMTFARPVAHLPDTGSLAGNILAGSQWLSEQYPTESAFVFCSADIPTITPAIVDEFVESCRPFTHDGYYTFVTREVMEARFPRSQRTFTKLKDVEIAGGDLHLTHFEVIRRNEDVLQAATNARKHAWKIAKIVGWKLIAKLLLRQLSFHEMQAEASRIVGGHVACVLSPHAELGMDADKPEQVELLRQEFIRDFIGYANQDE